MDSVSALRHPASKAVERNFDVLLDVVRTRPHRALIAQVDGAPAGFLLLLDSLPDEVTGEDQSFVAYMAVEPELRARGVGAALLARAEDEARRAGVPYISLMVTEENAAARALYERAGYVVERRLLCKTL
jgi:ribosomal protein S18 acetylase RimI-like enzyme